MTKKQSTNLEQEVWEKLKTIPDPELNISLVDLGLIYEVKIKAESVYIKLTLTTIGCPLFGVIQKTIEDKVKEVPGIKNVQTELTFDPPWSMDLMSEEAKLKLGLL